MGIVFLASLGCGLAAAEPVPLPRPRPPVWLEPMSFREAAGADFNSAEVTSAPSDCRKRLEKIAAVEAMPRLAAGREDAAGCGVMLHRRD